MKTTNNNNNNNINNNHHHHHHLYSIDKRHIESYKHHQVKNSYLGNVHNYAKMINEKERAILQTKLNHTVKL